MPKPNLNDDIRGRTQAIVFCLVAGLLADPGSFENSGAQNGEPDRRQRGGS